MIKYITLNIDDLVYLYNLNDIFISCNCNRIIIEKLIYTEKSNIYNLFNILLNIARIYSEILAENENFKYIKFIEIYNCSFLLLFSYINEIKYDFDEDFKNNKIKIK